MSALRYVLCFAALVGGASGARADGPDDFASPRSIGRAGTGTVSDDGGGALLGNPAAMARRTNHRVQIATTLTTDDVTVQPAPAGGKTFASAQSGESPSTAPLVAVEAGTGPLVLGAAVINDGAFDRVMPAPISTIPDASNDTNYLYRYAGLASHYRRRTVAVGAAVRATDWLAMGATLTLATVHMEEQRNVWAGFSSRQTIGDPARDVDATMAGDDGLVPGAVFGAMIAPPSLPLEFAASVSFRNRAHLDGSVSAIVDAAQLTLAQSGSHADLELAAPTIVRVGARYLADRWTAEVGVDGWIYDTTAAESWSIGDVLVVDAVNGTTAPLASIASRDTPRNRIAARGAIDVEIIHGLLWLTAGYAYTTPGTSDTTASPTFAQLGGHTVAAGIEASVDGITATLGWSHQWSSTLQQTNPAIGLDNPYGTGDAPTGAGSYTTSMDRVGLSLDVAWD